MSVAADPELLQEFLTEAGELLDDVDRRLVELEQSPGDAALLATVFRGFHTIKGGAGFLDAPALVELCHRTESIFDQLRAGRLRLTPELLDVVLSASAEVRRMFDEMGAARPPRPAPARLLEMLDSAAREKPATAPRPAPAAGAVLPPGSSSPQGSPGPDWEAFYNALRTPAVTASVPAEAVLPAAAPPRALPRPISATNPAQRRDGTQAPAREATLRVDTGKFDQILNLAGEIGLVRNRLACIVAGLAREEGQDGRKKLPAVVDELDTLVADLQSAVMKARLQPVGRVFQKYVRMVRDLSRHLGKSVELELSGEGTEVDKTVLEELNDPLVHLLRNAVDHGIETAEERRAAGKVPTARVLITAAQAGDQIVIEISDDGRGMHAGKIAQRAVEKGLISAAEAAALDEKASLDLIFLPGFSTRNEISELSGRGVGMDVVKTNIRKLNGQIDIVATPGRGSLFRITLPLTLAILPVLVLNTAGQPYALPLSAVREVIEIGRERVQRVAGGQAIVVRGSVLPLVSLADTLRLARGEATARDPAEDGRGAPNRAPNRAPNYGVVVTQGRASVILGVDAVAGRADVMIKPLAGIKPRGVAGATVSGEGELVLVLDLAELLQSFI